MTGSQVQFLFIDFALILLLARLFGALTVRLGQPAVIGEIIAGLLLGPTLLGPDLAGALFPTDVRPLLSALASVGVALFMFRIGLESESGLLGRERRVTVAAAAGSILLPSVLGIGVALIRYRDQPAGQHWASVVFFALALSVTAFPVLVRIVTDRGLTGSRAGGIAIAAAALADLVSWTALAALQLAITENTHEVWRLTLLMPLAAALIFIVRPLLRSRAAGQSTGWLTMALAGVLLCGAATEAMGLHYIFGAFLFGLIVPRKGTAAARARLAEKAGHVSSLLLPLYFVMATLNVDLSTLRLTGLAEMLLIVVAAIVGKVGGTYLGARSQGLPGRPAAILAVLMNTRGLTELIFLSVGLELGLLDTSTYSLLVMMTLVTTIMTGPLLSLLRAEASAPVVDRAPSEPRRDG
jgi:Kef-type K+ transport system membrane component KefB